MIMPKISEDQQAQRRSHILDAAELCFARSGFHRTTMQDICRQAGVSPGALYLYFDSKEALIDGIVARDREEVMEHLEQVAEAHDLLKGLESVLASCVLNQPMHKAALFVEIGAEACRNPRIGAAMTECDRVLRHTLESLLRRARAEGRLPEGRDVSELTVVMALLGDALIFRRATNKFFEADRIAPIIMEMVARLIVSGPALMPIHDDARSALPRVRGLE